jgi:hypothetical protein
MSFWGEAEAQQYIVDTFSGMVKHFILSVVTSKIEQRPPFRPSQRFS